MVRCAVARGGGPELRNGTSPAAQLTLPTSHAGFDPLRIGANPTTLPYLREAELMNGRWAMAGVAGILATDLLGKGDWWTAGAQVRARRGAGRVWQCGCGSGRDRDPASQEAACFGGGGLRWNCRGGVADKALQKQRRC